MAHITHEDWLAELAAVAQRTDTVDGLTVTEIADATGFGRFRIREMLRLAIARGAWEIAGTKPITALDGRTVRSSAYRPVRAGRT